MKKLENPELIADCGLHCAGCIYYVAHKTNNQYLKEKIAKSNGVPVEDIACTGCNSDGIQTENCRTCFAKDCVKKKGYEGCFQCDEFPCDFTNHFQWDDFIRRIVWDVNYRREHGLEKWIKKTYELNSCPSCQSIEHWKATVCKSCGTHLEPRYLDENDLSE